RLDDTTSGMVVVHKRSPGDRAAHLGFRFRLGGTCDGEGKPITRLLYSRCVSRATPPVLDWRPFFPRGIATSTQCMVGEIRWRSWDEGGNGRGKPGTGSRAFFKPSVGWGTCQPQRPELTIRT